MLGRWLVGPLALLRFVASPRSVSDILAVNIRTARTRAGFSQERLAEKANLSRNYIGNVERAEYKITVEALARIAKALKVTVHDLTNGI